MLKGCEVVMSGHEDVDQCASKKDVMNVAAILEHLKATGMQAG